MKKYRIIERISRLFKRKAYTYKLKRAVSQSQERVSQELSSIENTFKDGRTEMPKYLYI